MECDKMETEETAPGASNKLIGERQKYDWNETIEPHIKIIVVGESGCGKSSLILAANNGIFPHPEENFVSKSYPLDVDVDGKVEACMVTETEAGEENVHSRYKMYSEADVVLLCFDNSKTPTSIENKWVRELKDRIHEIPIILVIIKKTESNILSSELESFSGLLECCPHARRGVREVFQEAVRKARKSAKISKVFAPLISDP